MTKYWIMNLHTWSLCFDGNSKLGVFPCMEKWTLMESSFKNTNDLNGINGLTNVYFSDLGCAVTHWLVVSRNDEKTRNKV